MTQQQKTVVWGLIIALLGLYLVGLLAGWAGLASWHLLLVLIAVLFLYALFTGRRA
jgi:hypothetical protein